ncbi:hypothetical protein [Streptococcus suis]
MVLSIVRRLEKLKEIIDQQKEVSAEKALAVWIELVKRQLTNNKGQTSLDIPRGFAPPFTDTSFEDYEQARKVLDDYDG